ncbi:MAG: DUF4397 domain-containing protein [Gemmatimonadaceae bacterium]
MTMTTSKTSPRRLVRGGRRAALVAASAVVLAACGTTDGGSPFEPTGPTGRVRFVNVITDTTRGRVNAILESVPFGVNLTYTQTTPFSLPAPNNANYSPIYVGNRTLVLKRTADTNTVVATIPFTVAASQDQTIYATGGTAASAVTSFLTTDDNTLSATQARVRVVHLSPTAGAVDIFVTTPGADLAAATPTLANVAVRTASSYLAVNAGTYQVRVVPAGTAPASRAGAVAINVASLALAANSVRSIVGAENNGGGAALRAVVVTDR